MIDADILLYLSAAGDLAAERDLLARAVAEIPVSLGWRIVQSPLRHEPLDPAALAGADVHLLLVAGDIRAPIGLEWDIARRAGRQPLPFLKQGIPRTPAAQAFVSRIAGLAAWRPFSTDADLKRSVLKLLADTILARVPELGLSLPELEHLQAWRDRLEVASSDSGVELPGGAGESSIILSEKQIASSGGVLIRPPASWPR